MEHKSSSNTDHHKSTTSELFSSAKLVAEAAQATVNHDKSYNMDKAKVGAAADDILNAASEYGNLKEKGYGGYVDKASDYLHKYGGSAASDHSTTTTTPPADNAKVKVDDEKKHDTDTTKVDDDEEKKHDQGSGGFGGYMKMAQGFMK